MSILHLTFISGNGFGQNILPEIVGKIVNKINK